MQYKLKYNGKNFIFRENDLLKQGIEANAIKIIRIIFNLITQDKNSMLDYLEKLNNNKFINASFPYVSDNQDIFKQIITIFFESKNKSSNDNLSTFVYPFTGYNYDYINNTLRIYINHDFLKSYLQNGKYVKSRKKI